MKVRIGFGFGVRTQLNDAGFATVVDALERLRFDSLWLSERLSGDAPDPKRRPHANRPWSVSWSSQSRR